MGIVCMAHWMIKPCPEGMSFYFPDWLAVVTALLVFGVLFSMLRSTDKEGDSK